MNFFQIKKIFFITIFLLILFNKLFAQENISGWVSYNSLISTGTTLPFWFTHNQNGKYISEENPYQLLESSLRGVYSFGPALKCRFGLDYNVSYFDKLYGRLNQLFIEGELKWLVFRAGSFSDPVLYAGLSSSNGSFTRTVNYRPYPKIMFATNGYIPSPILKRWFSFKAEYDEGLLLDNRVVDRPHLHHKSLFGKYENHKTALTVELGFNHFVFWGGDSPTYGQLPDKLKDYFLYVTGRPGNERFPATDINVAGNQLGDYQLNVTKEFKTYKMVAYISHPFDDRSGMEFDNYKDNLYGIGYFSKNTHSFVEGVVYEFIYTKNQSGANHIVNGDDIPHERGRDNYFNHGVYSSGFTCFGYTMCPPLFNPVIIDKEGKTKGIANTRFAAHHFGMLGNLSNTIHYKILLTYSNNLGTYSNPFIPSKNQFLSLFELRYVSGSKPIECSVASGIDFGNLSGDRVGVMLSIKRIFKK